MCYIWKILEQGWQERPMNFSLVNPKQPPLLGIDINAAQIKLLELSKSGPNYTVESVAFTDVPLATIIDNDIKNPQGLSQAITHMHKSAKTRLNHVAVAVPGSGIAIKEIQMDANLSDAEREAQVWAETSNHFPDLIDSVSLDFVVLGSHKQDSSLVDVLLVASRSANVDSRVDVLEGAGLKVNIVDIDYYAYARAYQLITHQLPDNGDNKIVAMLNLSATTTTFIVLSNYEIIYFHDAAFNTQPILNSVQQQFGINDLMTELPAKLEHLSAQNKQDALSLVEDNLISHVRQFEQFFASAEQHANIDVFVLSGACSLIPGIANMVEEAICKLTICADPFSKMKFSKNVDSVLLKHASPAFMLSCGLAMRGLQYD